MLYEGRSVNWYKLILSPQAEGYAIWIDIEKMGGSTLEAMAHAVENAAVVLVCMSEKYKQSPNCRTGTCVDIPGTNLCYTHYTQVYA